MYIYVGIALFECLWKALVSRSYAYLRGSSPLWHVSGTPWRADFMHIYVSLALFGCLWKVLSCYGLWCQNGSQMVLVGSF